MEIIQSTSLLHFINNVTSFWYFVCPPFSCNTAARYLGNTFYHGCTALWADFFNPNFFYCSDKFCGTEWAAFLSVYSSCNPMNIQLGSSLVLPCFFCQIFRHHFQSLTWCTIMHEYRGAVHHHVYTQFFLKQINIRGVSEK